MAAFGGDRQIAVSWQAPADDGGAPITGYTAVAAPGGKQCTTTGALTCAITDLTNGLAYAVTVRAANAVGQSGTTDPVAATPRTVPGAPTAVTVAPGDGQAVVSWNAPASDGGSAITRYTALASPGGLRCTASSGTSCTITGLANGDPYTFIVVATNAAGDGPPSASTSPITIGPVPGPPVIVDPPVPGDRQATVAWTAPTTEVIPPITGYLATAAPGGRTCATDGTRLSCTITGLTNGTTYTITVTASNAVGTSHSSTPSASVTPRTMPGAGRRARP